MDHKNIIDAILKAEGGSKFTDDPQDSGGRTQYGIAERSNPEAWKDNQVTEEEARAIYVKRYIDGPGFNKISDDHLRHVLVDYAVNSGPGIAIQCLQRLVGTDVDGVLGPVTAELANNADPRTLGNRVVVERVKMLGRLISRNPSQVKYINGWLNRCLEFIK